MDHRIRRPWLENAALAGVALFVLLCVLLIRAL
jgi:hypothetical protein